MTDTVFLDLGLMTTYHMTTGRVGDSFGAFFAIRWVTRVVTGFLLWADLRQCTGMQGLSLSLSLISTVYTLIS